MELRSEADCEYPLDMRRLGKKRSVYVIHRQMCFLLTEIYLEFYGFLVLLGVISADLRCVFRMLFQAVFRVHVTEITKMSIFCINIE